MSTYINLLTGSISLEADLLSAAKKGIITQAEWAVALFQEGAVSLPQAAKVAGVCLEDFLDVLRAAGVPAVDYPAEELDDEMKAGSL